MKKIISLFLSVTILSLSFVNVFAAEPQNNNSSSTSNNNEIITGEAGETIIVKNSNGSEFEITFFEIGQENNAMNREILPSITKLNGWKYLTTSKSVQICTLDISKKTSAIVECYNYGDSNKAGAVTFSVIYGYGGYIDIAVDAGNGCNVKSRNLNAGCTGINAKSNWYNGNYKLKVIQTPFS